MPRFVVIGQKADASGEFLPDDVPGTSGRLDVLLRCVRAALLWSHGIREDVAVYLVLCGGPRAPRAVRIDGSTARFVRPDERSLATLARKTLASRADEGAEGFVEVRPGIAIARDGLESVLADIGAAPGFVLEEGGGGPARFPRGWPGRSRLLPGRSPRLRRCARESAWRRRALARWRVGPRSLHAEDVVAIVLNELDRRQA